MCQSVNLFRKIEVQNSVEFLNIFVEHIKIIFCYDFGAPLNSVTSIV